MTVGGEGRILIIEDEPSVADALSIILEDYGYEVVVATSGREGISQARRERFGVTITDLCLPDVDGLHVIRAVRESDEAAAVILSTSHGTPEVFAQARACGACGVIAKPFQPSEIIQLVRAALTACG